VFYQNMSFPIKGMEKIILLTDGVFDQLYRSDQEFGEQKMEEKLLLHTNDPINVIVDEILRSFILTSNESPLRDDITLLGISCNSTSL